jgi:predicted ATPase/DNA-binding winged helix-turn-helix (wHTH) protein
MQPDADSATAAPATAAAAPAAALAFGDFVLDIAAQRLTRQGRQVALPPRYFAVLQHLAGSGGRLVGKDELLDAVWGHRHVSDSVLKVAMNALRKTLGDDPKSPRFVETVARRGYRFVGARPVADRRAPDAARAPGAVPAVARAAPAATAARPARAALLAPASGNLPAPQPGLIGRDTDVQRVLQALSEHRLVTLHGPGGVGKTRLSLAAAAHWAGAGPDAGDGIGIGSGTGTGTGTDTSVPDGVWLLRLETMADAVPLLPSLARLLSLAPGAAAEPAVLARALSDLRLLLVLDNAEHIVDAVGALAVALLAAAPGVRLLVTTQVPLRVAGEQVLPLAPLALPAPGDPQAADSAALRLLLARVRQQQPEATLGNAALADAASICRALDGLPLALELAAARVPLLGWAGVRARLTAQQGLSLAMLNHGQPGAAERQRTLGNTLQWAFALLSPAQQRVLQSLSVFAGSFSVESAAAVAVDQESMDAVIDHLDALREHALLVRVDAGDAPPRWRLFDSVRSFAAQALTADGGRDAVMRRLLEHLTALFHEAVGPYFRQPLRAWVATLEPEADNLRRAIGLALAEPQHQAHGVALFAASALFRVRAGWRVEALHDLRRVQALPSLALDAWVGAELDLAVASICGYAQLVPAAEGVDAARRAQAAFGAAGDVERETLALSLECACLIRIYGELAQRQLLIDRMLRIEPPDWTAFQRRHRMWAAINLLRDQGDLARHDAACASYLALGRATGDENMVWVAAHALALALHGQGREAEAAALLERTVDDMRAAGQLRANAHVLALCAAMRIVQELTPPTLSSLREAAHMLQAEGRLWWVADALSWPLAWRGQWEDAVRVQAWADGLVRQRGERRGKVFGGVRRRFEEWLDAQPQAASLHALLATEPQWDETTILATVFC